MGTDDANLRCRRAWIENERGEMVKDLVHPKRWPVDEQARDLYDPIKELDGTLGHDGDTPPRYSRSCPK